MKKTELITPFGAKATIYHQGAQITSWIPSEALGEQIFLAQQSEFVAGKAIRGGVPVCFPQFGAFGSGAKHGFARNMDWQVKIISDDQTRVVFSLVDNAQTREVWPHAFELLLTVTLEPSRLVMALTVNNTGSSAFDFSGALHTYFAVSQYTTVQVRDFSGVTYWDNGTDLSDRKIAKDSTLSLDGALDRVYFDAPDTLILDDGALTTEVTKQGFTDVVVWNPGPEGAKGLKDMGDEEFHSMLCVEAAIVDKPIQLAAGEFWSGIQAIEVSQKK